MLGFFRLGARKVGDRGEAAGPCLSEEADGGWWAERGFVGGE